MDVAYFFTKRVSFLRQLYANASIPFEEIKRKIEAEEAPYVPEYSEDGEPPFLAEWLEADESLHVIGHSCVSMLAAALHLYFKTWEKQLGKPQGDPFKSEFKSGWLNGYRAYFVACFAIRFEDSPANLDLLEEIVLVRNRIQHPASIALQIPSYSDKDIAAIRGPFFVDALEKDILGDGNEAEKRWLLAPSVHITSTHFLAAMDEVEKFVAWLEQKIDRIEYGR